MARRNTAGMGFSKPKAITPAPAPPPVTTDGPEAARAADDERREQLRRQGYDWTLDPRPRRRTLLAPGGDGGKKQTLGGV